MHEKEEEEEEEEERGVNIRITSFNIKTVHFALRVHLMLFSE